MYTSLRVQSSFCHHFLHSLDILQSSCFAINLHQKLKIMFIRSSKLWFSPDGKSIVFTSDYAGVSAEPISNPHHYQPYGEIFIVRSDGSGVRRLTHNSFEDGTPTWSPVFMRPVDVEHPAERPRCSFDDCHWLSEYPNRIENEAEPWPKMNAQCGGR